MKGFAETSLEGIARHEAGHFLMNWLLEREPGGIAIMEDVGGVTIRDVNPGCSSSFLSYLAGRHKPGLFYAL